MKTIICLAVLLVAGLSWAGEKEEMAWKYTTLEEKGKRLKLEFELNEIKKNETMQRFKELSRAEQERLEAESKAKEKGDDASQ